MRTLLAALVFAFCLSDGTATLKLLRTKLKPAVAALNALKYLPSPVVVPEPIPATYARAIPTYTTHASTLSVSLPSAEVHPPPVVNYVPVRTAVVVYAQPYRVPVPLVQHHSFYAEPYVVEENYDEDYAKH